jgi:hypothetical protein
LTNVLSVRRFFKEVAFLLLAFCLGDVVSAGGVVVVGVGFVAVGVLGVAGVGLVVRAQLAGGGY